MCYLGGIWKRLEPLERIHGRFPSVDPSGRFASPQPFYIKPHKLAINRPLDHTGEM